MLNRRKVGMTSSRNGPFIQGYKRGKRAGTKVRKPSVGTKSQKPGLFAFGCLTRLPMNGVSIILASALPAVNMSPAFAHPPPHTTGGVVP